MALNNIKTIERDGNTYQIKLLPGRAMARCVWKLTKPATSVLNGPIKIAFKLFKTLQSQQVEGEGDGKIDLMEILDMDTSEVTELIDAATGALKEVSDSMDVDEFVDLLLSLFGGMVVLPQGSPAITITDGATYDIAFAGVSPDTLLVLALEVMRHNKFPFLKRVTTDFGNMLETISIFKEESEKEKS